MPTKLTQEEVIDLSIKVHGNLYDYSKVVYKNTGIKIEIICPKQNHGSFWQRPYDHYGPKKCGCPMCGTERRISYIKLDKEEIINRFIAAHGNLYDYSKVVYVSIEQKVEIICKKDNHGSWWTTPKVHYDKHGCPKCCNEQLAINNRLDLETAINNFNIIHGNKYDYSKVIYIDAKTKIEIICKKEGHGIFWQKPRDHYVRKCGCPKCGNEKAAATKKINKETVLERFYQAHGNKYDYSEIGDNMNTRLLLKIICKVENHPPFYQNIGNHLLHGCLLCGNKTVSEKLKADPNEIIKKMKIVHNNFYDYSLFVYSGSRDKSIIICPKENHGQFLQASHDHLRGQPCPKCSQANTISDGCIDWLDSLGIPNDNQHREVSIKLEADRLPIKADGFILETKTIYEYNGDWWHGNPEFYEPDEIHPVNNKTYGQLYINTLDRENRIKAAGFNLITIWESDWLSFPSDQQTLLQD